MRAGGSKRIGGWHARRSRIRTDALARARGRRRDGRACGDSHGAAGKRRIVGDSARARDGADAAPDRCGHVLGLRDADRPQRARRNAECARCHGHRVEDPDADGRGVQDHVDDEAHRGRVDLDARRRRQAAPDGSGRRVHTGARDAERDGAEHGRPVAAFPGLHRVRAPPGRIVPATAPSRSAIY